MGYVYIVEDDESIGQLVSAALRAAGHETRLLSDASCLADALNSAAPELILLDIMLPDRDGFSILSDLKANPRTAEIPVILLSSRSGELDKVRGLELGAEDYVTKPFGILELQARVKTALRRKGAQQSVGYMGNGLAIDDKAKAVIVDGRPVKLTHKEMELLECLARNAGHVVSRDRLLDELWGYAPDASASRTVDFHISCLRQKLGDSAEDAKYIETVRGYGYRLRRD